MENMRKLNVTVQCMAVYNSSIMVPRELTFEEAIKYAKEHIDEINIGELEYISDSDELDEENCDFDEEDVHEALKPLCPECHSKLFCISLLDTGSKDSL